MPVQLISAPGMLAEGATRLESGQWAFRVVALVKLHFLIADRIPVAQQWP